MRKSHAVMMGVLGVSTLWGTDECEVAEKKPACPSVVGDCRYNPCPPTQQITPKANPYAKDGTGLFTSVDFIYWMAHEDQLNYAMSTGLQNPTASVLADTPQGRVYSPDFDWNPGVKVGLGGAFCSDGWDLGAEYTWYQANNSSSTPTFRVSGSPNQVLYDMFWIVDIAGNTGSPSINGIPVAVGPYGSASAKWHLHMNVLDLALGRNFYVSPRLKLRPFLGLKGVLENQTMQVEMHQISGTLDAVLSMNQQLQNRGAGIRAGLNTAWQFTNCFSLLGNLAFTGLWEHFRCTRYDQGFAPSIALNSSQINVLNTFSSVKPIIEWMLGFRWETWTARDRVHVALDAGWEEQIWFGQNQFIRIALSANGQGDLVLQGLTAKARIDY